MSQKTIDISTPDDGLGDVLRTGFDKTNQNFTELYNGKVDKVTGKGLSENDFTDADKSKLDGIEVGAQVNVNSDWGELDPSASGYILNKPPSMHASVGHFNFSDLATQTTPLVVLPNTPEKLTNDTLGAYTELDYAPFGIATSFWNTTNNQFDFSNLTLGDSMLIRVDLTATTTYSSNQTFTIYLKLGIGTASEYDLLIDSFNTKTIITDLHIIKDVSFSIDNVDWKNAPAEVYILSDDNATVKVNGWYVPIVRKSVNIIDFNSDPLKLDKVTTTDVEKVYIKNADGTQGMKPVSEFGGGGSVQSVTGDSVDNTDPLNPIINAIPLSGTTAGNPVTGDIIINNSLSSRYFKSLSENTKIGISDEDAFELENDNGVSVSRIYGFGSNILLSIVNRNNNTVSNIPSTISSTLEVTTDGVYISNNNESGRGIYSVTDFTPNITDLDYVQKKYVDTKVPKVTSSGVERAYIINADGSQSTKPTSEFGTVKGTGTINRISKFTAGGTIGDSQIFDDGTNVGIGTTTPTTVLDVQGKYTFNTGTARPLRIVGNSEATTIAGFGTGMVFGLKIGSGSVEDVAHIDVINTQNFRSGELSFRVSQGSSPVEAMRINYLGRVGIGTTSPQARLDVKAQGVLDTDIVLRVRNSTDTANLLQVNGQGTLSLGLQSSAPTGIEGAIYYDSTTKKHRGFNGTAWNDLY